VVRFPENPLITQQMSPALGDDINGPSLICLPSRFAASTYGRGQHLARLNFGDCFSYALAKSTGEPLFKGGDFAHPDIAIA
jgi:hypothetical protein